MSFIISDAFAAEDKPATTTTTEVPGTDPLTPEKMMMDNLLMLGALFAIFYFILIRPQQKRIRAHQEMMKALQKGEKVMTTGGLYGTIVKFEGDEIVLVEIAPEIKVRVARSAITEVIKSDAAAGKNANDN